MTLFPALAPDAPTGLGTAMAGGKGRLPREKTARRELDFYPTPADATRAFLLAEAGHIRAHGDRVWECCGRGGAIARELTPAGFTVHATDLVADPDNQVAALDVLRAPVLPAPIVVTNPPFAIAGQILEHVIGRLGARYLALLLKTTFFSTDTADRGQLGRFVAFPPSMRWDMTWRVDFLGGRHPLMNCSWFVWDAHRPVDGPALPWGLLQRTGPVHPRRPRDLFHEGE